ncbi:MAG: nuclear transport factor 2 family protein [Gemmatirosa sp.]
MPHADVIREIYGAFGRGDVPAILARLAEDVEWEYGVNATSVPWLQPRRGRDAAAGFFEAFAGATEMHRFEVKAVLQDGNLVVAVIDIEFTVRATGRRVVEEDEVHVWRFADDRVVRFRHRADTHQQQRAYEG